MPAAVAPWLAVSAAQTAAAGPPAGGAGTGREPTARPGRCAPGAWVAVVVADDMAVASFPYSRRRLFRVIWCRECSAVRTTIALAIPAGKWSARINHLVTRMAECAYLPAAGIKPPWNSLFLQPGKRWQATRHLSGGAQRRTAYAESSPADEDPFLRPGTAQRIPGKLKSVFLARSRRGGNAETRWACYAGTGGAQAPAGAGRRTGGGSRLSVAAAAQGSRMRCSLSSGQSLEAVHLDQEGDAIWAARILPMNHRNQGTSNTRTPSANHDRLQRSVHMANKVTEVLFGRNGTLQGRTSIAIRWYPCTRAGQPMGSVAMNPHEQPIKCAFVSAREEPSGQFSS